MRHWTQQERKQQSQLIQLWKPWQHSTGAKTKAGKFNASRNAFKGGFRQTLKELRQLLRAQKQGVEALNNDR